MNMNKTEDFVTKSCSSSILMQKMFMEWLRRFLALKIDFELLTVLNQVV